MIKLILASLILLGHLGCAREGNPYGRIHEGSLEVAVKSFTASTGPKVTLLGAVHIGEKSYYQQLQKRLDKADLVLFEGIGLKAERQEMKTNCPEFKSKGGGHAESAQLLKLECQTNNIKKKATFVHADMSLAEYLDHKKIEMGKPLCERLKSVPKGRTSIPPKVESDKLRNMVALSLVKDMSYEREYAGEEHILILFKRNEHVIKKLEAVLPKYKAGQEVIIFYGAAHMLDIERSLLNMGYTMENCEWLQAFSL